ncbi:hypothetical protein Tco_0086473 [Tanacetum coccineum]
MNLDVAEGWHLEYFAFSDLFITAFAGRLKNLFEKLQDQEDDIFIASCGESSGGNTMTKDSQCNEDTDSEVEETFVETNPYIVKPKGASTPSNDVSNVYVCAILESHVDLSSLSNVCKKVFRHWDWTSNVSLCDSGCRIIVGWNVDVVNTMVIAQTSQALHMKFFHKATNQTMFCSFIYASNSQIQRRLLWDDLGMFKLTARGYSWVLMGDFNVALNMEDIYAGVSSLNAAMYEFKDCVSKIEVADINSSGLHYTWNQRPKGGNGILKKLDRIMGNIDFMDCFPGDFAVFQPYRTSDHAPAVLKLPSVTASKPKLFKFFNFLAYKSNFLGLVEGKWSTEVGGHNMFQVVSKMKSLKKPLRKLLKDQGNIHEHVNKLRLELDQVQKALVSNAVDSILREKESVYLQAFNDAKIDAERISDISALNMVRDVTNKEIKTAMFDIGDDKAPGPDGFTSTFFKKSWHIVGNDVCNAVRDFFNNGCLLKEINHTFLALIPKVSTPLKVNDYRPISCCNVIYKCISKILTNRVIEGIKDVVSDNQSAFIPGRRISDNILVTQELMHNYHNHRGPPRCAFKIDIQKAYDTVDWAFLENILGCFGFPNAMIRWIMACVSSTSFSLCINGNIHGYFKGKRGLRQGDPLSPYLFTMVMEVLTLILKKRVRNSDLFRYHKQCEELEIINVCFADDLFIFARGDVNSARVILESLEEFKLASGLVPSLPKSTAYFCNVIQHVKQAILNIMPFSEGDLPVTYLGVPLISSRLLNRDCKIHVENAKNRIGDWRNKSLSFAGRLQLLESIKGVKRRDANGGLSRFSVAKVWEAIRPRGTHVDWFRIIWFSHAIPRHSFNLWLIMRNSLKTQDHMRQWDVGNDVDLNLLQCALCESQQDSHTHLFFECPFSVKVWNYMRSLAGMELVPPVLQDIVAYIQPMQHKRTVKSIFGKLVLAASAYFIWNERNDRLFKKVKKSPEDIRDHIMITLRLKILSLRFKDTAMLLSVKVFHWRFGALKGFVGLAGSFFYV